MPGASLGLNFLSGSLDSRIVFTRAPGPATFFDVAGAIQTAGTNVPRFDFDPVTHAPLGLFIEEARTNLLLNSATLSTQSITTTAVATTLSFYGTGTITKSGTATGALVGSGAFPARVTQTFTPTAGTLTLTVSGSVLNAQIEVGSTVTSWIPTTGASATRAAEIATMPIDTWFNLAAGTYLTESQSGGLAGRIIEVNDGTLANLDAILVNGTGAGGATTLLSSASLGTLNAGTLVPNAIVKLGYSTMSGARKFAANGGTPTIAATGTRPATITTLRFGSAATNVSFVNGYIRHVRYFPRAMSGPELQSYTV